MSVISPTFVTAAGHGGAERGGSAKEAPALRSRSSIAAIVNMVRNPVGSIAGAVGSWYDREVDMRAQASVKQINDSKKRILYMKLQESASYDAWRSAAEDLDALEDNDIWKGIVDSSDYDSALVAARLHQLEDARSSRDVARMAFLIRTALTRDLGRMGNVELYKHSHIGTKDLIERYIDSALDTIQVLVDLSSRLPEKGPNSHRHVLEQVLSARQAFGRSALLLSGGGTFGMAHNGVLKALWEHKLLPRIISGASAGSIVSAIMCTRTDEEIPELLEEFCHGDLSVFEEEGKEEGYVQKAARFLKHGHLYDISHLIRVMKQMLGDMTFQEGYNRTRRILNICVSSASLHELPRLLNYVTAPNVIIWSAVAASCSVPLIFSPAQLLAKDARTGELVPWDPSPQKWIDGSVDNDLPMTRLAEMFNVNHFIVSQVNPHVVPFLSGDEGLVKASDDTALAPGFKPSSTWLHTATNLAKGEALYRLRTMADFGIFPNALTKAASILNQKYSGDITILPAVAFQDLPLILKNPTEDFMIKSALLGERATWPKLSRIRNHCAIELALDDAVQNLRTRVVFSSSQVDLRHGAYAQAKSAAKRRRHRHHRENSVVVRSNASSRPSYANKRSMSQHSEPDASLMMATKGMRLSGRPGSSASGHSGKFGHLVRDEPKSQSIQLPSSSAITLASPIGTSSPPRSLRRTGSISPHSKPNRPISFQAPPSPGFHNAISPMRPRTVVGLADISSSGADTSGIYTSDEEEGGNESEGSVTSTELHPNLRSSRQYLDSDWQAKDSERNIFPNASQPPTPLATPGFRPFSLTFTPASPPNPEDTGGVGSPKSSKTKRRQMSGAETRYKQIFHGSTKAPKQAEANRDELPAPSIKTKAQGKAKSKMNALGLELPLVGRKKAD